MSGRGAVRASRGREEGSRQRAVRGADSLSTCGAAKHTFAIHTRDHNTVWDVRRHPLASATCRSTVTFLTVASPPVPGLTRDERLHLSGAPAVVPVQHRSAAAVQGGRRVVAGGKAPGVWEAPPCSARGVQRTQQVVRFPRATTAASVPGPSLDRGEPPAGRCVAKTAFQPSFEWAPRFVRLTEPPARPGRAPTAVRRAPSATWTTSGTGTRCG